MKTYKIMVSREVTYLDFVTVEVEAPNLSEALRGAIADAEEGYIDSWEQDDEPTVQYTAEEEEAK